MTDAELTDLLLTLLTGTTGRMRGYWRRTLGPMTVHGPATQSRSNWSFALSGSDDDVDVALKAIDVLRARHPHVDHTHRSLGNPKDHP